MLNLNFFKIDQAIIGMVIIMLLFLLIYKNIRGESAHKNEEQQLNIDKLIEQVKRDLEEVDIRRTDNGKAALFKIDSFDLEINFLVKETSSGEIGANYELVTVGGKSEVSAEKVQKISLHMKAIDYNNNEHRIKGDGNFVGLPSSDQSRELKGGME